MRNLAILLGMMVLSLSLSAQGDYSLNFSTQSDYVEVPASTAFDVGSGDFTFEARIKADLIQPTYPQILARRSNTQDGFLFGIRNDLGSSGNGKLYMQLDGAHIPAATHPDLRDSTWHHVAVVRQSGQITYYVDGLTYGTHTLTNSISSAHALWIGWDDANRSQTSFNGLIDDVAMWNIARDSSYMQSFASNCILGTEPGLIGYWAFREGLGTTTADLSPSGNHALLQNGAAWDTEISGSGCITAARIAGNIYTAAGIPVRGAVVNLAGSSGGSSPTGSSGDYDYNVVPNGNYTVTPSKSNDIAAGNGISTLDILLMQRHILGTAQLGSPYKIIAADVDGSQSVSTLDIILARSLILGNTTSFPNGRLWTFVRSDFVFTNPLNPFPFDNFRSYTNVTISHTGQNFIGIKLGDVNNSWDPNIP